MTAILKDDTMSPQGTMVTKKQRYFKTNYFSNNSIKKSQLFQSIVLKGTDL